MIPQSKYNIHFCKSEYLPARPLRIYFPARQPSPQLKIRFLKQTRDKVWLLSTRLDEHLKWFKDGIAHYYHYFVKGAPARRMFLWRQETNEQHRSQELHRPRIS